jgi:type IV pilus assembly protein PilO
MALLGLPDDPAKQRLLLIGVIPLVGLFAYWYFFHSGYTQDMEAEQARLENLETRNAQARARAPQSVELEERLAVLERHMERLEQLVPRGEEVSALLNTISERANQIGVRIVQFTPGRTERQAHYNLRTFQLTVVGEYHDIGRFLAEIGSLPRIISPVRLSLLPVSAQSDDLQASFMIETYVLPELGSAEEGTATSE